MSEKKEVKSYKINVELKEKLETLFKDSGMETQEQWIESLANLYEMQQLKEGMPGYKKTLDELEYHTKRVNEIFVGMINTEAAERLKMTQGHEEILTRQGQVIFDQQAEITDHVKQYKLTSEELAKVNKEKSDLEKQTSHLEDISRKNDLLVNEYKEKNDTLTGLVNEYKGAAEENKQLSIQVLEFTQLSKQHLEKITDLQLEIADLEELSRERIRSQDLRYKEDLERLIERKDVEKERELLQLRSEYQTKLEKNNEETTVKLRELYEQINQLRQEHEQQITTLKKSGDKK